MYCSAVIEVTLLVYLTVNGLIPNTIYINYWIQHHDLCKSAEVMMLIHLQSMS